MHQGTPYLMLHPDDTPSLLVEHDVDDVIRVKMQVHNEFGMYQGTVAMSAAQFERLSLEALAVQREIDVLTEEANA
jgi:hypothetical protein